MTTFNINGWILWFIASVGTTVFITRSWWLTVLRVAVLRRGSAALFCGGCVGFWVGIATVRWFPLELNAYFAQALSALASMLLGYALGSGDYEGALETLRAQTEQESDP